MLGQDVGIIRFAGGGATDIIAYLQQHRSIDVVVAVWLLNELFHDGHRLVATYPRYMDALAGRLATELKRYPHHIALVGGSANLWNVNKRFDAMAEHIRSIFLHQGIPLVDGVECYAGLTRIHDGWHAASNDDNKMRMASYFGQLVREHVSKSMC